MVRASGAGGMAKAPRLSMAHGVAESLAEGKADWHRRGVRGRVPAMQRHLAALFVSLAACASLAADSPASPPSLKPAEPACRMLVFEQIPFTVCKADVRRDKLRLFNRAPDGSVYGQFDRVSGALAEDNLRLGFAMNAGMYHADRRPVGLYIEAGETQAPLNLNAGPGNFHLLPNGVFWVDGTRAGVSESSAFAEAQVSGLAPDLATQSGPMLVLDGELHPRLLPGGTSKLRRNGVGVRADGHTVLLAISDAPVNFHTFARLFRDRLDTPNALYLDGRISRLYAPRLDRHDAGPDLGPIIGLAAPQPPDPALPSERSTASD